MGLLSDTAALQVKALLPEWAASLSDVCSWADHIGHAYKEWHWSLRLHYVDTPPHACNFNFTRDCRKGQCVVAAIFNYTNQLQGYDHANTITLRAQGKAPLRAGTAAGAAAELLHVTQDRLQLTNSKEQATEAQQSPLVSAYLGLPKDPRGAPQLLRRALSLGVDPRLYQEEEEGAMRRRGMGAAPFLPSLSQDMPDPSVLSPTVALMFLAHFVGDIHQPLHVGFTSDYGGNTIKVHWFKKATNLHEVWDTELIKHGVAKYHGSSAANFTLSLSKRLSGEWAPYIPAWASCPSSIVCPNTFARESIRDACHWAYEGVKTGDTLTDAYFESRFPVVEVDLAKAAVRLAATLNRLFPDKLDS